MSDLQIALLVIAGVLLAALYVAGKWQERRLLRRLSEELGGEVGDALLGDAGRTASEAPRAPPAVPTRARIEPHLESKPAPAPAHPDPSRDPACATEATAIHRSDWIEDPMLDCVLELRCTRPVDGVSFIDAAMPLAAAQWPMPVAFVVWDARAEHWVHPDRFGYYTDALAAIQLANRRHALDEAQIARFVSAVRQAAAALDADCDPPDVARVAAGALDLDRLCARFDVRIGLNLQAASGAWTEIRVAAAAAQASLAPVGTLRWAPAGAEHGSHLVLSMPASVSDRLTLELDVPTTAPGTGALQALFSLGNQLGAVLSARIVDDNGRPIDSQSMAAIEAQLAKLYEEMKTAGIDPGGERARRLYV